MTETSNSNPSVLYETAIGNKNQSFYADKFRAFDQKGPGLKVSWNWAAFFFTGLWALYRKMYGWFLVWSFSSFFFTAIAVAVFKSFPNAPVHQALAFVIFFSWLGFAVFANSLYHSKIKARIATANKANSDTSLISSRLHAKGGINSWVPIVFGVFPAIGIAAAVAIPAFLGKTKEQVALTQPGATSTAPAPAVAELESQAPSQPKPNPTDYAGLKKLAEQGDAEAQLSLGVMYGGGHGVLKDEQSAYFWWLLSSARGVQDAAKNRDIVERRLSPAQRAAAQTSARSWQPASKSAVLIMQAAPAQKSYFDGVDFNYVNKTTPPPAPAAVTLGPIDSYRYTSCQKDASFAPTPQGVNVGLRLCREKFGQ